MNGRAGEETSIIKTKCDARKRRKWRASGHLLEWAWSGVSAGTRPLPPPRFNLLNCVDFLCVNSWVNEMGFSVHTEIASTVFVVSELCGTRVKTLFFGRLIDSSGSVL